MEEGSTNDSDVYKMKLMAFRALGILQILFGAVIFCLALAIISSIKVDTSYRFIITIGEGIWCSIWIFPAGGLAIATSYRPSKCLVYTTLGWSIFAANMSACLFFIEISFTAINHRNQIVRNLNISTIAFTFVVMILLILTSVFCCTIPGCCSCCEGKPFDTPAVVLYNNNPQGGNYANYESGFSARSHTRPQIHPETVARTSNYVEYPPSYESSENIPKQQKV